MLAPTKEILDFEDNRRARAKQILEQCEYEARKNGLIFVPEQRKSMTPSEYNNYLNNAES